MKTETLINYTYGLLIEFFIERKFERLHEDDPLSSLGLSQDVKNSEKNANNDESNSDNSEVESKNDTSNDDLENNDADKDEKNKFSIRIKWLSKSFDNIYTTAINILKKRPSFISTYKKIMKVYEMFEFFIKNIEYYNDDEKNKIYITFQIALKEITEEIKNQVL